MELANFETKEKQIGSNVFYVTPMPALQALSLLGDLQAIVTTGLSGATSESEGALLDKDLNLGTLISAIGRNLRGPALVSFAERIAHENFVSVKRPNDEMPVRLSKDIFNNIFKAHLRDLFELIYFVLEVNYSDFFEDVPSLTGALTNLQSKN